MGTYHKFLFTKRFENSMCGKTGNCWQQIICMPPVGQPLSLADGTLISMQMTTLKEKSIRVLYICFYEIHMRKKEWMRQTWIKYEFVLFFYFLRDFTIITPPLKACWHLIENSENWQHFLGRSIKLSFPPVEVVTFRELEISCLFW